jgi:hypothetical protein
MDFGPERERERLRVGTEIIYKVTGHHCVTLQGLLIISVDYSMVIIVVYCIIIIYCCLCDLDHMGNISLGCCVVSQTCVVCYTCSE